MVAILRVPGVMFQQREVPVRTVQTEEVQACLVETESATINTCQPAQEDRRRPPSVISGAISGAGSALGGGCTGFTVGNPPVDGDFDVPDAEGGDDAVEPEDVTENVDTDGDGEPDEVADDGEIPEVHDDGEIFDFEDGEVEEDGETTDPCANSPVISATTSPIDADPAVILTPILDWDASDLDAGDTLTYRVRVWRTDAPSTALVDETVSDSQYAVPAGILVNNENYSWQIDAWDTCSPTANLISSPVWTFTTVPACAEYTFTDPTDMSLPEDRSAFICYTGDVVPEDDGWTMVAPPSGWRQHTASGGVLYLGTIDSNEEGFYSRSIPFGDSLVVETRMHVSDNQGMAAALDVMVRDNSDHQVDLRFLNEASPPQIREANTGEFYPMDTTSDYNTYRIVMNAGSYQILVNGVPQISGSAATVVGTPGVSFFDFTGVDDSQAQWDYICWHPGGSTLPYASPHSFEGAPIDTGAAANGHEGATISWNPASAAGTVTIAVRAADSLADLATASWSAELTDNPATIPAGVIGRYLQWRITLTAPVPTTTPVVDQVAGSRICP